MRKVTCPICGRRLFDIGRSASAEIVNKCTKCKAVIKNAFHGRKVVAQTIIPRSQGA